jgi:Acyl-CoA synthetases (AMP-forming)/AMP-acid ligases II
MYAELKQVRNGLTEPEGNFEITTAMVRGIPTRTYKNAPPSLRELWLASQQFADREYIVYQDERWTYAQAHEEVASIAAWLVAQGVEPGDRVAIAMRNYPEFMLIYWAIASIGATVVGMNAWWVTPEMRYGLNDAKPKVLFLDGERYERIKDEPDLPGNPLLVAVRFSAPEGGVAYETVRAHGGPLPAVTIDPDSDACIFYTSGTTGNPKGALQTHRGCVNNVMNLAFWAAILAGTQLALGNLKP